jgi:ribokinase
VRHYLKLFSLINSSIYSLVTYVKNFPKVGETIIGLSFEQTYGGKGANQAVMLTRLGSSTGFCVMLGADSYGIDYQNHLKAEGILSDGLLQSKSSPTGVACITVAEGGANMIVINPGANYTLTPDLISTALPTFESARTLICQNEILPESTRAALAYGRGKGMLTIFNPAPISSNLEILWDLLSLADIVCPNETELFALLNGEYPIDTEEEICQAALALVKRGARLAVVTMGKRGACVVQSPGEEYLIVPAPEVPNSVDTVGAGDCFVGKMLCPYYFVFSIQSFF